MADIYEFWVWPKDESEDHTAVLATSRKGVIAILSHTWKISKKEVARKYTIENMGFFGRERRR